jgi:ribosomal protein S18 acetylase RimI-like enzyme
MPVEQAALRSARRTAATPSTPETHADGIHIKEFTSMNPKDRATMFTKVARIEKKTFPSSEAFNFDLELKKSNTKMILALREGDTSAELLGYLVYVRMKRLTLLHKICVVEQERNRGVGKLLIHSLRLQLEKAGCDSIHLWVDEARQPARYLYESFGFQKIDRCLDYYGPNRTGLKMELCIEH